VYGAFTSIWCKDFDLADGFFDN
jgi:hypothetical protein